MMQALSHIEALQHHTETSPAIGPAPDNRPPDALLEAWYTPAAAHPFLERTDSPHPPELVAVKTPPPLAAPQSLPGATSEVTLQKQFMRAINCTPQTRCKSRLS
jgi:hypothetical protein